MKNVILYGVLVSFLISIIPPVTVQSQTGGGSCPSVEDVVCIGEVYWRYQIHDGKRMKQRIVAKADTGSTGIPNYCDLALARAKQKFGNECVVSVEKIKKDGKDCCKAVAKCPICSHVQSSVPE